MSLSHALARRPQQPQIQPKSTQSALSETGKFRIDLGDDPLATLTQSPDAVLQFQQAVGNRATVQMLNRLVQRSERSSQNKGIIQRVKNRVQGPANGQVASMRAIIPLIRAQIAEYVGYPVDITDVDDTDVTAQIDLYEQTLSTVVTDLNFNDNSVVSQVAITGHYPTNAHWLTLKNTATNAVRGINKRFTAWTDWCSLNPDTRADLQGRCSAADLGLKIPGAEYGEFAATGLIYKAFAVGLPTQADGDETQRYYKRLKRLEQIGTLRGDVGDMDMTGQVVIPRESGLNSRSGGATRMKEIVQASGNLICSRVMSAGEAEKTRQSGGHLIAKLSASKWFTIGGTANINSSGDEKHNVPVNWTVSGNFRKVLMMEGMHNYNENEVTSSEYREPYWVWKDNEAGNIALSPVLTAIFNDMITATTVNGEAV